MGKPTISETGKRQLQLLLVGGSEREFADLRQLLREANHGHICFEHATSLEDSLNKLRRRSYDLLLCSDHSTDNVAFQLLRQMRQHYSGVPIIFLSDPVNREAIETAVQAAGCHGAARTIASNRVRNLPPQLTRFPRSGSRSSVSTRSLTRPCANSGIPWSRWRTR